MAYEVLRADGVARDLELIFEFLVAAPEEFGESPGTAFARAEARLEEIEAAMATLAHLPHQGTRRPDLGASICHVTKGRAVVYFDTDEASRGGHRCG